MAFHALGDALDDAASISGNGDPLLAQLHLLAVAIQQDKSYIDGQIAQIADANAPDPDWDGMTQAAQAIVTLQHQFQSVAAARATQTAAQQASATSWLENAINAIGTWAEQVLAALPAALAAIPDALITALGTIATNTGKQAASALVPFAAIAVGLIGVLLFAEKSHTFRKYA